MKKKLFYKKNDGYTLLELVVAIGVFAIAVSLVVGVFFQVTRTQKLVNALIEVKSNTSIMLEQMAREIRTGFDFRTEDFSGEGCDQNLTNPSRFYGITFTRIRGNTTTTVQYAWNSTNKTLTRKEGEGTVLSLNASNMLVNRGCFVLLQSGSSAPWRITMLLNVTARDPRLATQALDIQTTVSSRVLPNDIVPQ